MAGLAGCLFGLQERLGCAGVGTAEVAQRRESLEDLPLVAAGFGEHGHPSFLQTPPARGL